jgi:hypothetical protein
MKRYHQYNDSEEKLIIINSDPIMGNTVIKKCLCAHCNRVNRVRYPNHVIWMCATCDWCGKGFWLFCKGKLLDWGGRNTMVIKERIALVYDK